MNVEIKTVDHSEQRYDTVGDWQFKDGVLKIRVSKLGNVFWEHLIAVHEYCEALICMYQGVSEQDVDRFDLQYHGPGEPGDCTAAPYFEAHQHASGIERTLAAVLRTNWKYYDETVSSLTQGETEHEHETSS